MCLLADRNSFLTLATFILCQDQCQLKVASRGPWNPSSSHTEFCPHRHCYAQWLQNKLITTSHSEVQAHVCYPSWRSLTPAALTTHRESSGIPRHQNKESRSSPAFPELPQPARQLQTAARVVSTDLSSPLSWLALQSSQMPLAETANSFPGSPSCPCLLLSVASSFCLPQPLDTPPYSTPPVANLVCLILY